MTTIERIAREDYMSMTRNGMVTDEKRKAYNSWQKRTKGYQFVSQTTPTSIGNLELSGSAKMFLGFNFKNTQPGDTFTFTLNEEIICQDANAQQFDSSVVNLSKEFFEYLRFLSGRDTMKIEYKTNNSVTVTVEFYYI